jgi:hypothetical protein
MSALERALTKEGRTDVVKNAIYSMTVGMALFAVMIWTPMRNGAAAQQAYVAPMVFQAAGPTVASIQASVDAFRAAFGGANNGNAPGPITGGRREINWDGGGATTDAPAPTPFTGFQANRGALFTTPGTGFVQATVPGLVSQFANVSYETRFQFFSPSRVFSAVGSNVTETRFFLPGGQNIAALTNGFGAIFSGIDQPDGSGPNGPRGSRGASTFIEFYDIYGTRLFVSDVPASPGASLSFFGVIYPDARIARVRITSGDGAPGPDDSALRDIVMMDDFIYGEPVAQ